MTFPEINRAQIEGFVRHMLTAVGGWLLGNGLVDAGAWDAFQQALDAVSSGTFQQTAGGILVAGLGVFWSWYQKRSHKEDK